MKRKHNEAAVTAGLASLKEYRKGANLQSSIEKLRDQLNDDALVQEVVNAHARQIKPPNSSRG